MTSCSYYMGYTQRFLLEEKSNPLVPLAQSLQGLRYSLQSCGWARGTPLQLTPWPKPWVGIKNAVWRHLMKSSVHGSFWLGLLFSTAAGA